jgi:hypothetical protein
LRSGDEFGLPYVPVLTWVSAAGSVCSFDI